MDTSEWEWRDNAFEMDASIMPAELDVEDSAWIKEHGLTVEKLEPHGLLLKTADASKFPTQ